MVDDGREKAITNLEYSMVVVGRMMDGICVAQTNGIVLR